MKYTGDVTVEATWKALQEDSTAVLIDVRTQPEWAFVGVCDLSAAGKMPLLISWQDYPHMAVNEDFATTLEEQGVPKEAALYFLCRSGVRSQAAAATMIAAGYDKCYNVIQGFEGDVDAKGHRGTVGGWKAAGLPWGQR